MVCLVPAKQRLPDNWRRPTKPCAYRPTNGLQKSWFDTTDIAELDRLRSPIGSIQWDVAKRALVLGVNVILEWGFWSQAERIQYRTEAEALGAHVELSYLNVGFNELWDRLWRRNANLPPGAFIVTKENLEIWTKSFEPPTEEELGQ